MTTVMLLPKKTDKLSGNVEIEIERVLRDEYGRTVAVVTPTGTIFPASRIAF